MSVCSYNELKVIYREIESDVKRCLEGFDRIAREKDRNSFVKEFIFCLLTPQSKARSAQKAVEKIWSNDYHIEGSVSDIIPFLRQVRFLNNKASYIIKNRKYFLSNEFMDHIFDISLSNKILREYLVKNIIGYGYKEASHFLRNIGRGHDIAILDRHILKGLCELGCICDIPKTISKKNYIEMEGRMKSLSEELGIDIRYMDYILWYRKTKDIFK